MLLASDRHHNCHANYNEQGRLFFREAFKIFMTSKHRNLYYITLWFNTQHFKHILIYLFSVGEDTHAFICARMAKVK